MAPLPPLILPTPEQQFLATHYESNAKSSDRDPRQTFRTPTDPSNITGAGVVGPLGSSSFSLPTVERALVEMEGGGAIEKGGERDGRRVVVTRRVSPVHVPHHVYMVLRFCYLTPVSTSFPLRTQLAALRIL